MFRTLSAALAAAAFALPALAEDALRVSDAYARLSPHAGAVFLVIENPTDTDDRLVAASTEVAERAELHTNIEDANGVVQMVPVEDGIPVPAGGTAELARGGDHIMLMGLTRELKDGDSFTLTLTFAGGTSAEVDVIVDNARKPGMQGGHQHGSHDHGAMGG